MEKNVTPTEAENLGLQNVTETEKEVKDVEVKEKKNPKIRFLLFFIFLLLLSLSAGAIYVISQQKEEQIVKEQSEAATNQESEFTDNRESYILDQLELDGSTYPKFNLSFESTDAYQANYDENISSILKIYSETFILTFSTSPENQSNWWLEEEVLPNISTINGLLLMQVFRIEEQSANATWDYYYTTGYESIDEDRCVKLINAGVSSLQACDNTMGVQIGDSDRNIIYVRCKLKNGGKVEDCDKIVESLNVELSTE